MVTENLPKKLEDISFMIEKLVFQGDPIHIRGMILLINVTNNLFYHELKYI